MGLVELRERALLSRKELAERIGITRQTLSLWETGKNRPRMEHIRKLIEALNVDAPTLFAALEEDQSQKSIAA